MKPVQASLWKVPVANPVAGDADFILVEATMYAAAVAIAAGLGYIVIPTDQEKSDATR